MENGGVPARTTAAEFNRGHQPQAKGNTRVALLQPRTAAVNPQQDSAAEREILLNALRLATARSRLITNLLESVGTSLRHKQIDCEKAMEWLAEEGCVDLLELGPGGGK
jgi:hypothetical protein